MSGRSAWSTGPAGELRARGLGIPFDGTPGPLNAVTDVQGVEVGYATLIEGEGPLIVGQGPVRTGVTALLPLGRGALGATVAAGWFSLNGNGEMTGTTWIEECGGLDVPVAITNTHAVGPVHRGVIEWVTREQPSLAGRWLLPVVAETWDGYLNDVNGRHVLPETAVAALDAARAAALLEGSVGGGAGMNCYGYKGGTGTASRVVRVGQESYTVGALLQANFGSRAELTIAGVRMGPSLMFDNPMQERTDAEPPGAGSCIVIVATDAPLLPGQCKALARRVPLGLARTGTTGSHFSGDIFLAFSTANAGMLDSGPGADGLAVRSMSFLPWGALDSVYEAVVQVVEEATVNALVAGRTMVGRDGHRTPGLPLDRVLTLLHGAGRAPAG